MEKNANIPASNSPREAPSSWLDSASAKVAAAVVTVGATVLTARDAVSRAFFKTVNKTPQGTGQEKLQGAFTELQHTRDVDTAKVFADFNAGKKIDVPGKIGEISKKYDSELKLARKKFGFTGVLQEAKVLRRHQWLEVAFATGAVASVAIGAIVAIASSRSAGKGCDDAPESQHSGQQR